MTAHRKLHLILQEGAKEAVEAVLGNEARIRIRFRSCCRWRALPAPRPHRS